MLDFCCIWWLQYSSWYAVWFTVSFNVMLCKQKNSLFRPSRPWLWNVTYIAYKGPLKNGRQKMTFVKLFPVISCIWGAAVSAFHTTWKITTHHSSMPVRLLIGWKKTFRLPKNCKENKAIRNFQQIRVWPFFESDKNKLVLQLVFDLPVSAISFGSFIMFEFESVFGSSEKGTLFLL